MFGCGDMAGDEVITSNQSSKSESRAQQSTKDLDGEDNPSKAMSSTGGLNRISVARTRVWSHEYNVKKGCDVAVLSRISMATYPAITTRPSRLSPWTCLKTSTQFRMPGYWISRSMLVWTLSLWMAGEVRSPYLLRIRGFKA